MSLHMDHHCPPRLPPSMDIRLRPCMTASTPPLSLLCKPVSLLLLSYTWYLVLRIKFQVYYDRHLEGAGSGEVDCDMVRVGTIGIPCRVCYYADLRCPSRGLVACPR